MRLLDGTILMDGDLAHRAPYDPTKAHEYYLKNRHLKGRKKAAPQMLEHPSHPAEGNAALQRQRKMAAEHVHSLQSKLAELHAALKKAMAEEGDKKPTAADKHKAQREAKKYRDTHKQELKTKAKAAAAKSGGSSSSSAKKAKASSRVATINAAIDRVQSALVTAKARQRALG